MRVVGTYAAGQHAKVMQSLRSASAKICKNAPLF